MKPDCFTNYDAMPRSVCSQCAYRGPCARKTVLPAGLTLLPLARFPKSRDALEALPGVSASLDDLADKLTHTGFYIKGKRVRHPSGRAICKVDVIGPVFTIETVVHRDVVASLPAAVGCDIRHRILAGTASTTVRMLKVRQDGSLAYCPSVESACRLILALAVYQGQAHE